MNTALIQPYLYFAGRCEEALAFYRTALGAQLGPVFHFKDSPQPFPPGTLSAGFEHKIMHASFTVGATTIMASDGFDDKNTFSGFSLALNLPTIAEVDHAFNALAEGGQIRMPLAKTFWSPRYGVLTDRFGINWKVSIKD